MREFLKDGASHRKMSDLPQLREGLCQPHLLLALLSNKQHLFVLSEGNHFKKNYLKFLNKAKGWATCVFSIVGGTGTTKDYVPIAVDFLTTVC